MAKSTVSPVAESAAPVAQSTPVVSTTVPAAVTPKKSNKTLLIVVIVIVLIGMGICAAVTVIPGLLIANSARQITTGANDLLNSITNGTTTPSTTGSTTNTDTSGNSADLNQKLAACTPGCRYLSTDAAGQASCVSLCQAGVYMEAGQCDKVEAGITRDACYTSLASNNHDASQCSKVSEGYMRTACLESAQQQ